jgi:hypothetical protein
MSRGRVAGQRLLGGYLVGTVLPGEAASVTEWAASAPQGCFEFPLDYGTFWDFINDFETNVGYLSDWLRYVAT